MRKSRVDLFLAAGVLVLSLAVIGFSTNTSGRYMLKSLAAVEMTNKGFLLSSYVNWLTLKNGSERYRLTKADRNQLITGLSLTTDSRTREGIVYLLALQRDSQLESRFVELQHDPSYEVRAAALFGLALLPELNLELEKVRNLLRDAFALKADVVSVRALLMIERHDLYAILSDLRPAIEEQPEPSVRRALQLVDEGLAR